MPSEQPHPLRRPFLRRNLLPFWLPLCVGLGALFASILIRSLPSWIQSVCGLLFLGVLLYFLVRVIVCFCKKRVAAGFGALACLGLCLASLLPAFAYMMFEGMFMPDTFAADLQLPEGVPLQEPARASFRSSEPGEEDTFQATLMGALSTEGAGTTITTSIPSLRLLQKEHPELLQRTLAAHPGWRVFEKRGNHFATRRWMVGDRWQISLHGYYSRFGETGPNYQSKTTLAFSGKTWRRSERLDPDVEVTPDVRLQYDKYESAISFDQGGVIVELFEQSRIADRRLSRAAIAELERELAPLAADPTWETARGLLPDGAIVTGAPSFVLLNSSQGGIYQGEIRANPGEPGRVYLKAFEITQGTPLSTGRLAERANEWIGWSDDPSEQFLAEVHFTIYEGNWGEYYGARFEVWFVPDAGGEERKLLEGNWKIEGWMH